MKKVMLSLVAASLLWGQTAARAATFGQFTDGTLGSKLVNTFAAGNWTSATLGGTFAVEWNFVPSFSGNYIPYNAGAPVGINIPATLTYTATTANPSAASISGFQQNFDSVTLTVTGTGSGAAYGTLLQMTSVNTLPFNHAGFFSGNTGATSATFQGSDQPNASNTVIYSSPYIDFAGAMDKAYALSYSGATPPLSQGGTFPNNYINNFSADTTGTFSAIWTPTVTTPEPGVVSMLLGLGLSGGLFLRRRRR